MEETKNNEQTMFHEESEFNTSADPSCQCSSEECDCTKPAGRNMPKLMICLAVLLAVVGIVGYKTFFAAAATDNNSNGFNITQSDADIDQADQFLTNQNPVDQSLADQNPVEQNPANQNLANQNFANQIFGESLGSLDDLNVVAIDMDVVLIFIPGSDNGSADDTTNAAALAAQQTFKRNDIKLASYVLPSDSPGYSVIADQVQAPVVLVAVKGSGIMVVPCDIISEEQLLQAFLSCCDTSGGCCGVE
jgi:hypothetical protein